MSFLGFRNRAVDGRAKPGHDGWRDLGVKYVDIFGAWYYSLRFGSKVMDGWRSPAMTMKHGAHPDSRHSGADGSSG
jgi:hypothetical protein